LPFLILSGYLNAQQSYTIAVASQNTYFKNQRWITSEEFPHDYIKEQWGKGFFITGIQNYYGFWTLVLSKAAPFKQQTYITDTNFPQKLIDEKLNDGYFVSNLCYNDSIWAVIMTSGLEYENQKLFYTRSYPTDEIHMGRDEGYNISRLQYANGIWILVLTKGKELLQSVIQIDSLAEEKIQNYLNDGYHITDVTYDGRIIAVVSKGMNWGQQEARVILYSEMSEPISQWWKSRYCITSLLVVYNSDLEMSSCNNETYLNKFNFLSDNPKSNNDKRFVDYINNNPGTEFSFRAVQKLAGYFLKKKEWGKGIGVYKKYKNKFPQMRKRFENIIRMLKSKDEDVVIENLGPSINTDYDEYFPIINLKGDRLYFCSYNRQEGYGGEDIYTSELKNKKWEPAKNIGDALNSNSHEATLGVSGDEITLTVFGNYPGSLGNGDIFYYSRTKDGWSKREHYPAPVNSLYFDSDLCFSSDGNAIFFVSDRPVGESYSEKDNFSNGLWGGNPDIYVIYKTESGWSSAVNLGSIINSQYAERSPFIHPDGKTLYYSSKGHYGVGGLDVFKTTRLNPDSWTEWSQPVNLGKEVNTIENDWGYRISLDGEFAYFSAFNQKDTIKRQDIFRTTLPESLRPDLVAIVKGKVIDSDGNPLMAKIKWENLSTGMTVGELSSDPDDGSFFIALPLGMKYGFYADKEGYYPVSKNLNLTGKIDSLITLSDDIVLVPIKDIKEKNISVRINNLFFDYDSSVLLQESRIKQVSQNSYGLPGFQD